MPEEIKDANVRPSEVKGITDTPDNGTHWKAKPYTVAVYECTLCGVTYDKPTLHCPECGEDMDKGTNPKTPDHKTGR